MVHLEIIILVQFLFPEQLFICFSDLGVVSLHNRVEEMTHHLLQGEYPIKLRALPPKRC